MGLTAGEGEGDGIDRRRGTSVMVKSHRRVISQAEGKRQRDFAYRSELWWRDQRAGPPRNNRGLASWSKSSTVGQRELESALWVPAWSLWLRR